MKDSLIIQKERLLIVEGEDERRIIEKILENLNITNIQIFCIGGKEKLKSNDEIDTLSAALKTSTNEKMSLKTLGIIIDADTNRANSSFRKVCSFIEKLNSKKIKNIEFEIPTSCGEFSKGKTNIGVFIMPDCQSEGMLETLFLSTASNDNIMNKSKEFIQNIGEIVPELTCKDKRIIQTYIANASSNKVYRTIGDAFSAGLFDISHPILNNIKEFLKQMSEI